jgi:hypothetical protein
MGSFILFMMNANKTQTYHNITPRRGLLWSRTTIMFQLEPFLAALLILAVLFIFRLSLLPKQSVALAKITPAPILRWTLKMNKS